MDMHPDTMPIPQIFGSFETGQPIANCKVCDQNLMETGTNYMIEKAFKNGETIFEHALCHTCYTAYHEAMSADSRLKILTYFEERLNMEERHTNLMEQHGTKHEKWISHCMVTGFPIREVDEYQLYGFCIDKELVFCGAPYALCGEVIEEITNLLSSETLGVMADLSQKLFGFDVPHDLLVF
jgi:hypothetical protein